MKFSNALTWMKHGKKMRVPGFLGYWYWGETPNERRLEEATTSKNCSTIVIVTKNNEKIDIRDTHDVDFTFGFINSDEWEFYQGPDDPREIEPKENDSRPIDEEAIDKISTALSILGLRHSSGLKKTDKKITSLITEIIDGQISDVIKEKLNSTWLQIGRGKKTLEDFHRVQAELERHAWRVTEFNTALAASSDEDGHEDEYKGEKVEGFLPDHEDFFVREILEKIAVALKKHEQFKDYTVDEIQDLFAQGKIYPKSVGEGHVNNRGETEVSFTIDYLPFTEAQAPLAAFSKTAGASYKDVETNLTAEMVLNRLNAINVYQIVKNSFVDCDETYRLFKQSLSLESLSIFIDEATNRILENFDDTCHSAETQFEGTRARRNLYFCVKNLRGKLFETMGDVLNSQETNFPDSASHFFDVFVVRLREFGEITSLRWVDA